MSWWHITCGALSVCGVLHFSGAFDKVQASLDRPLVEAGDQEQDPEQAQALRTEKSLAELLQAKDRRCALGRRWRHYNSWPSGYVCGRLRSKLWRTFMDRCRGSWKILDKAKCAGVTFAGMPTPG